MNSLDVVRMKLGTIKAAVQRASSEQKKSPISVAMAESFNGILGEVAALLPQVQSVLPTKLKIKTPFSDLGFAEITYLDLEIYADQVLGILALNET